MREEFDEYFYIVINKLEESREVNRSAWHMASIAQTGYIPTEGQSWTI